MNLTHYYWYFKSVIPIRICDDIVRYAKSMKNKMANIGDSEDFKNLNQDELKDVKNKRDSSIVWLDERWIYKEVQPYVHQANASAGWNFQWDHSEDCQFTEYKTGQHYGWHCDAKRRVENKPNTPFHGKTRKLSVTVSLSDPKDYKGGELEFDFRNHDSDNQFNIKKCAEILPKGSVVVFPSFVWHRVCPVIEGSRYSLVVWNLGWPFK